MRTKAFPLLGMLLAGGLAALLFWSAPRVEAGIYNADGEVTYKEYWVPHSEFTGGCHHPINEGSWYLEPWPGCVKELEFTIADDFMQALRVELYLDIWRGRLKRPIRFKINNGRVYTPTVGFEWSRSPYLVEIPKAELKLGANVIAFWDDSGGYHIHDIAFRIYHDASHPLLPGPGSDATPPNGQLTTLVADNGSFDPQTGGTLLVNNNQITLTASATDAAYVEFHAFYEGYDEDNDGQTRDWHNLNRNNYNPGGIRERPSGGTINHIGTDVDAPYMVVWRLPHIVNQPGVKFKIRLVDGEGNVREGASGISSAFTLAREYAVEAFRVPNFQDAPIHAGGDAPKQLTRTITLTKIVDVTAAYLVSAFWNNPYLSINGGVEFLAFESGEEDWALSIRSIDPATLKRGPNVIKYSYNSRRISYGQFVEKPGPMIVVQRSLPGGPTPPTPAPTHTPTPTRTPTPIGTRLTPAETPTATLTASTATPTPTLAPTVPTTLTPRVSTGLQALYLFNEGNGVTVSDLSGVGAPLNLTIGNGANSTWLAGGGLQLDAPTTIASAGAATKIVESCRVTNEVTIEAWLQPASLNQGGPARIVTLSNAALERNFTLGQGLWGDRPADLYSLRLRLDAQGTDGLALSTGEGTLTPERTHLVFTRNAAELGSIYLNGVHSVSKAKPGALADWKADQRLVLASELNGERPWLGSYYLVAIYCHALSLAEVQQNFRAGVHGVPGVIEDDPDPPGDDPLIAPGIHGLVWVDGNTNGEREADEPLIAGAGVTLLDGESRGAFFREQINTASDGRFRFDDLPAGEYILVILLPLGYTVSNHEQTITVDSSDGDLRFVAIPVQPGEDGETSRVYLPLVER